MSARYVTICNALRALTCCGQFCQKWEDHSRAKDGDSRGYLSTDSYDEDSQISRRYNAGRVELQTHLLTRVCYRCQDKEFLFGRNLRKQAPVTKKDFCLAIIPRTWQITDHKLPRLRRSRSNLGATRYLAKYQHDENPDVEGWDEERDDTEEIIDKNPYCCTRKEWLEAWSKLDDFVIINAADREAWAQKLGLASDAKLFVVRTAYAVMYDREHPQLRSDMELFSWDSIFIVRQPSSSSSL